MAPEKKAALAAVAAFEKATQTSGENGTRHDDVSLSFFIGRSLVEIFFWLGFSR